MEVALAGHGGDIADGRWHQIHIPLWVVLLLVGGLIFEIMLMGLAFIAGMRFQRRYTKRVTRLPEMLTKTKTGDRLHHSGCFHLRQGDAAGSLQIIKVCDHCREKINVD